MESPPKMGENLNEENIAIVSQLIGGIVTTLAVFSNINHDEILEGLRRQSIVCANPELTKQAWDNLKKSKLAFKEMAGELLNKAIQNKDV
jgi:hypothetical protein